MELLIIPKSIPFEADTKIIRRVFEVGLIGPTKYSPHSDGTGWKVRLPLGGKPASEKLDVVTYVVTVEAMLVSRLVTVDDC